MLAKALGKRIGFVAILAIAPSLAAPTVSAEQTELLVIVTQNAESQIKPAKSSDVKNPDWEAASSWKGQSGSAYYTGGDANPVAR